MKLYSDKPDHYTCKCIQYVYIAYRLSDSRDYKYEKMKTENWFLTKFRNATVLRIPKYFSNIAIYFAWFYYSWVWFWKNRSKNSVRIIFFKQSWSFFNKMAYKMFVLCIAVYNLIIVACDNDRDIIFFP